MVCLSAEPTALPVVTLTVEPRSGAIAALYIAGETGFRIEVYNPATRASSVLADGTGAYPAWAAGRLYYQMASGELRRWDPRTGETDSVGLTAQPAKYRIGGALMMSVSRDGTRIAGYADRLTSMSDVELFVLRDPLAAK